jgi:hypothetical protein
MVGSLVLGEVLSFVEQRIVLQSARASVALSMKALTTAT